MATQEARAPDSALFALTVWLQDVSVGLLFVQQLFIEYVWLPGPVRDAGITEVEEVTPWSQGTHSGVWEVACEQLVLIQCTGAVSKWSMVGLYELRGRQS